MIKMVEWQDHVGLNDEALWQLMLKRKNGFSYYYKAYSHLRKKNWILRTGLQYGAHFVAYRDQPSQVHAEYEVFLATLKHMIELDDQITCKHR